jgi:hypothetical protein
MNSLSVVKGMKVMLLSGIAAGAICALPGPCLADDNRRQNTRSVTPIFFRTLLSFGKKAGY